jgi:thimet oligopeptidase
MFYAMLSLSLYEADPTGVDTTERLTTLRHEMTPTHHVEGTHFQASFGHLHGYSAIYYTYMWSLVISKDLFSAFDGDPMNIDMARRYRECVLAPGGRSDAADLVADFLGRPYQTDAWEKWLAE